MMSGEKKVNFSYVKVVQAPPGAVSLSLRIAFMEVATLKCLLIWMSTKQYFRFFL